MMIQQQQHNEQQSRMLGYQYQQTSSTSGSTEPTSTIIANGKASGSSGASGSGVLAAVEAAVGGSGCGMTIGDGQGHIQVVPDVVNVENDLTACFIDAANVTTGAIATASNSGDSEAQFDLD